LFEERKREQNMTEWPSFVKHAFSAVQVIGMDEQEIQQFMQRWGGLDVQTFVRTLHEGTPQDQQVAAFAVGSFRSRWARDLLLPFLHHDHAAVRWTVALELGRMREEEAFPVLLHLLQEFLPPHHVSVEYDWYDIHHISIACILGAWGKREAVPALRETLSRVWQAERDMQGTLDMQLWWHYQDAMVASLGQLGDFEALEDLQDLPASRKFLWAVTLVMGYLGYLTMAIIPQNTIIEQLMATSKRDEPAGCFALIPDLLHEKMGFSPEEAATFSLSYQQAYLNRWEQDAPPFVSLSEVP
jgi:HEAT repeat protein